MTQSNYQGISPNIFKEISGFSPETFGITEKIDFSLLSRTSLTRIIPCTFDVGDYYLSAAVWGIDYAKQMYSSTAHINQNSLPLIYQWGEKAEKAIEFLVIYRVIRELGKNHVSLSLYYLVANEQRNFYTELLVSVRKYVEDTTKCKDVHFMSRLLGMQDASVEVLKETIKRKLLVQSNGRVPPFNPVLIAAKRFGFSIVPNAKE